MESIHALRWRITGTVDGPTYRRLLEICKVQRIELSDLVGYLLAVGCQYGLVDLEQVVQRESSSFTN